MLCSHYLTFATVSRGSVYIQLHTVGSHVFAPSRSFSYTTHSRECNFWMNRAHSDAKCTKNKHYSADTHILIFDSTVSHKIYTRTLNVAVEFRVGCLMLALSMAVHIYLTAIKRSLTFVWKPLTERERDEEIWVLSLASDRKHTHTTKSVQPKEMKIAHRSKECHALRASGNELFLASSSSPSKNYSCTYSRLGFSLCKVVLTT